jgi:hypothetical protein
LPRNLSFGILNCEKTLYGLIFLIVKIMSELRSIMHLMCGLKKTYHVRAERLYHRVPCLLHRAVTGQINSDRNIGTGNIHITNNEGHSPNHCSCGKYAYVTFVIQYAKCMHRDTLSSVACLLHNIFSNCLINGTIKKKLLKVKCVFDFLYHVCLKHFSS